MITAMSSGTGICLKINVRLPCLEDLNSVALLCGTGTYLTGCILLLEWTSVIQSIREQHLRNGTDVNPVLPEYCEAK